MASQAGPLDCKRCHKAQVFSVVAHDQTNNFLLPKLKRFECTALPGIRCVRRLDRPQAGQTKHGTVLCVGQLANQTCHIRGINFGQCHPCGGNDIAVRVFQIGVRLNLWGHRHINASVTGVPASGDFNHAKHVARTFNRNICCLLTDIARVGIKRRTHHHRPSQQK